MPPAAPTPDALRELELDEELQAILRQVRKKSLGKKELESLRKLAEQAGTTRVGRRAAELARIAVLCVD